MQHYLYASVTLIFIMPSPRKRIGYLPAVEVQEIIDNICREKGLSQSKVTGLLVEEALKKRGVYEPRIGKKELVDNLTEVIFSDKYNYQDSDTKYNEDKIPKTNIDTQNNNQSHERLYTKNEFDLLKDYIEFKRFKSMMRSLSNEETG